MASLQTTSTDTQQQLSVGRTSPQPRSPRDYDVTDGLPGGSSQFREVMAELHPPSLTPSPSPSPRPRRRKSTQLKRVHYVDQLRQQEQSPNAKDEEAGDVEEEEEQSEEPRQILHGKCHCYFVHNGNVTGLADSQCHHEHRLHPPTTNNHTQLAPLSSPRPSSSTRRISPTSTPGTLTPEASPRNRQHHKHPQSSLQPPQLLEGLRGRSNSDVGPAAGLWRLSSAKKRGSLSPTSFPSSISTPTSPNTSPSRRRTLHDLHSFSSPSASPSGGRSPRMSPERAVNNNKHRSSFSARQSTEREKLSQGVSSLRLSPSSTPSPPATTSSPLPLPPILVQDTSQEEGGREGGGGSKPGGGGGRRLSNVSSDQLHYVYEQLLTSGTASSSS